nr:IS66 family transposase [Desulfitobacterium hafniense]
MKTNNLKGIPPEVTEYISKLEAQIQAQNARIDKLTNILSSFQKNMYGQSSEKSKYLLGEESNQISIFNEAEVEANRNAPEPTVLSVSGHARKAKRTKE